MKYLLVVLTALICNPFNVQASQPEITIEALLTEAETIVHDPDTRKEKCVAAIKKLKEKGLNLTGAQFNNPQTLAHAQDYLSRSFALRLEIRQRLKMVLDENPGITNDNSLFDNDGQESCIFAIKNLF
ncbi:MAG: hypothetical protein WCG27_11795 [Pseudomonadota bacterium]